MLLIATSCGQDVAPDSSADTDAGTAAGADSSGGSDTELDAGTFNNLCVADDDCAAQFPDLGPCQQAMCNTTSGLCAVEDKADGTVVSPAACAGEGDEQVHTQAVECTDGQIGASKPQKCTEFSACAVATCDPTAGCGSKPKDGACDDGNKCTTDDSCVGGVCKGGSELVCDGSQCQTAKCDAATGACMTKDLPAGAACSDGDDKCTADDKCDNGKCAGTPIACDDGDACTKDACKAGVGCEHTETTGACDDGNACTGNDTCAAGKCEGTGICKCQTDADCVPFAGGPCGFETFCDKSKGAPNFQCVLGKPLVTCTAPTDVCLTSACDDKTGKCAESPAKTGTKCDDDNLCTDGDACEKGKCAGATAVTCPTAAPCSSVACDPKKGCQTLPKNGPCEDGDSCTTDDGCAKGFCKGGPKKDCDDKNGCTADACNPKSGCTHDASTVNGVACSDDDACTDGDVCAAGKCDPGPAKACDDKKVCTKDSCDKKAGCAFTPIAGCNTCGSNPQCVGADLPTWELLDANPTSPFTNQTYAPSKFKGIPFVLFFLHGY